MECLDANVVQDLMSGALDGGTRDGVLGHLDTCSDCRELLGITASDVARQQLSDTAETPPAAGRDLALDETVAPRTAPGLQATMAAATSSGLAATVTSDPRKDVEDGLAATMAPTDVYVPPPRLATGKPVAGKHLGRYELVEKLGAGAMGVVWAAEDPKLGRRVALKLLKRADESLTERLQREAQSMAQVSHPNVVTVYEVDSAGDQPYIAMELVAGQSLRTWQIAEGRTVPEIVEAYIAAGRGLYAAHAAGVIHRDFKPDNVLVGTDGRVRVTDFGLAAAKPGESGESGESGEPGNPRRVSLMSDVNLTTSGSVLGTPAYMAPEQFTGGNVDSRTDQFNFCVSLYEALYGERPYEGKTFEELGDNVRDGRVKPAPAGTEVSTALRAIVLRGMAVKPGDRFATLEHLLAELGRDRARPWRRTAVVSAVLAGVLVLGLGANWVVRDRVDTEIRQAFSTTGRQVDRAFGLLASRFDAVANQAYFRDEMHAASSHRDQADFGLGAPEDDAADLDEIHSKLMSADWRFVREFGQRTYQTVIAVADYKGRLLFSSAAPSLPRVDLSGLSWIKRAREAGRDTSIVLLRTDDPELGKSGMLGPSPGEALVFLFTRTLFLNGEAQSQLIQVLEAGTLLDDIRLDDDTKLSIVGLEGTAVGDLSGEVTSAALHASGDTIEVAHGGSVDEVQRIPISDSVKASDGHVVRGPPIGYVVMAQTMSGVVALFPGARTVFALAALAALGLAIGTERRARRITGARI